MCQGNLLPSRPSPACAIPNWCAASGERSACSVVQRPLDTSNPRNGSIRSISADQRGGYSVTRLSGAWQSFTYPSPAPPSQRVFEDTQLASDPKSTSRTLPHSNRAVAAAGRICAVLLLPRKAGFTGTFRTCYATSISHSVAALQSPPAMYTTVVKSWCCSSRHSCGLREPRALTRRGAVSRPRPTF